MRKITVAIAAALAIAGCTKNTGILETGAGVYLISISAPQVSFGPPVQQKADAYKQANDFCKRRGSKLETVNLQEFNQVFGRHGAVSLEFKCA